MERGLHQCEHERGAFQMESEFDSNSLLQAMQCGTIKDFHKGLSDRVGNMYKDIIEL
jgi:hypothetical protein